jgi:hypothetical protein
VQASVFVDAKHWVLDRCRSHSGGLHGDGHNPPNPVAEDCIFSKGVMTDLLAPFLLFETVLSFLFFVLKHSIMCLTPAHLFEGALMSAPQEAQLQRVLRGEPSKIYWLLLKNTQPVSVHEIQRQMNFSRPLYVIQSHLTELTSVGLAEEQSSGNYLATGQVQSSVLRQYVNLGRLLFPRYLFYALFATLCYFTFLLFFIERFIRANLFIGFVGAIICIVFWYEARRFWTRRPY